MDNPEERGLRLLSLDGGGIRGLSTLFVLQSILLSVQDKLNLPEVPLPCDFFDLIGGTSTGGLIALMLGRLRMPVEKAIEAYVELSKDVFAKKQSFKDGKYSAAGLEAAVRKIVEQYAGDASSGILDSRTGDDLCRTFVCTVTAKNMSARSTTLIRSYKAPGQLHIPCTIIEAARATTAAPTFFERAVIKVQGINREFLDGGVAQNNPCDVVLKEAALVFPGRSIACIISIGTGKLPVIQLERPDLFGNIIPLQVAKAMAGIATDTEYTHQTIQGRFSTRPNVYFRFNVDEGMQDVTLDEWNKLDDVASHAEKYMGNEDVRQKREGSAKALVEQRGVLNVSVALGTVSAAEKQRKAVERKHCPPPSRTFTGRADILAIMNKHFSSDSTNEQLMIVLYGLGGSGKSEIMRRFVANSQVQTEEHQVPRFSGILYVDASSAATLEVDLANISMDKKIGENAKDTISWLARTRDRWLLILDNADDAALDLRPYIPSCSYGNIIITTRNKQLRFYDRSLEVSRMSKDDAKDLFVRRSCITNSQDAETDNLVTRIIEELDFLALGIVQAAAYLQVHSGTCTLEKYLARFLADRHKILEKYRTFVHKPDDYEGTVYTTWNISLEQLQCTQPEAVTFLFICSFLHHKNIPQAMFIDAASSAPYFSSVVTTLSDSVISWVQDFLRPFIDPDAETSETFDEVVAALGSYSLVEITPEGNLSFHRLVHDWSRNCAQATETLYPIHAGLILRLSVTRFWADLNKPDALDYTRTLLPHMQELQTNSDNRVGPHIAHWFQHIYICHGWWMPAETVGTWAMRGFENVHGKEHPDTLRSMAHLALSYQNMGRWAEAEELEVTVMETRKRLLGVEHTDTLATMGNLASMYFGQGRLAEAEQLLVTVTEKTERMLGVEHPNTLKSMSNLASTYWKQGRWTEAEKLQVTVMETMKRVLGEEHPHTLTSMGNLALTYWKQGRWTEAEKLQVTVMETSKRVLGEEHPDTLTSMGNLTSTYWKQGRWTEAEKLEVTVMETSKRCSARSIPTHCRA